MKKPIRPDATELLRQMESGERTAVSIVTEHLERLEANQARLNAATHVFKDEALAEAKNPRSGLLSGLPISIKETIGMAGQTVTAGSRRMPPIAHTEDAPVVQKLRDAGAIILARSNVPEFAMAGETDNLIYGRTNNPLDESRVPGGSSGGEGALVGSGSTALGIGTDILGSIRIPAAFCGVVGFKPTSSAVSKQGIWPDLQGLFLDSWLGVGPLTRSVRDARLVYGVIANAPLPEAKSPSGLRLIIPRQFELEAQADCINAAYTMAQTVLEMAGLVTEERPFPDVKTHFLNLQQILAAELEKPFYEMLVTADGQKFSLATETLKQAVRRGTIYSGLFQLIAIVPIIKPRKAGRVAEIIRTYEQARADLYQLLGEDGVLLLPTIGVLAPKHGQMNRASLRPGVNGTVTAMTFCNYMNLSAITVPAWKDPDPETGLVPGVMLACAPGAEAALLDAAAVLEAGIS
ncbi:amidase [Candidatus Leptofilum sp.]|uniref:amidase n=1 Tax=Candidatus Leptofilum sp. TaxID=3241576 RepID=UPI003B5A1A6B